MEILLAKRKKDSHKGTFGRAGIIGGSRGMTGAPYLTSKSCLRTGSGLVYTISPKMLETILCIKLTEAIVRPVYDEDEGHFTKDSLTELMVEIDSLDVIGIGPGMGVDDDRVYIMENIISGVCKPMVIDADGLNCISKNPDMLKNKKSSIILTPHPGEMARLLGTTVDEIESDRLGYASRFAKEYGVTLVLKGSETVVSSETGETYINKTGNPGMATAGSGDVLTGVIVSLLGQRYEPYDAARLGVYIHGLAGDIALEDKGEYGMIARDILENIPKAIRRIESM